MVRSVERLTPLVNGRKKATYVCLLFIACFILPVCNGQNKNGINEYNVATWNTNGAKWRNTPNILNVPMVIDSGVEVLAVQEAGNTSFLTPVSAPTNVDIFRIDGTILPNINKGIDEYNFYTEQQAALVYRFNRRTYNQALNLPTPPEEKPRYDLVIVSRHQPKKVILLEHTWKNCAREFKNKPALGIVINKTVFFSLYAEPCNTGNEAPYLVNAIQKYMNKHHSTKSWIAMGDFNRVPADLEKKIENAPRNKFRQLISSGENTHTREIDYAVVGGPISYFRSRGVITVPEATLLRKSFSEIVPNPSDHEPVQFKRGEYTQK